jgi:hypothetical protein
VMTIVECITTQFASAVAAHETVLAPMAASMNKANTNPPAGPLRPLT